MNWGDQEDRGSERLAGLDRVGPSWQAGVLGGRPGGGVKGAGHFSGRDEDMERAKGSRAVAEVKLLCRLSPSPCSPGPLGLVTGPGRGWPWRAVVWGGDSGVR